MNQELTEVEEALLQLLKERGLDKTNASSVMLIVFHTSAPEVAQGELLVWVYDHPEAKTREIFDKAVELAKKYPAAD